MKYKVVFPFNDMQGAFSFLNMLVEQGWAGVVVNEAGETIEEPDFGKEDSD